VGGGTTSAWAATQGGSGCRWCGGTGRTGVGADNQGDGGTTQYSQWRLGPRGWPTTGRILDDDGGMNPVLEAQLGGQWRGSWWRWCGSERDTRSDDDAALTGGAAGCSGSQRPGLWTAWTEELTSEKGGKRGKKT
jgi:hypothetical protein